MPRSFITTLAIPWVDRTIAVLASIPFAVELYRRWAVGHVSFQRTVLGLQILVLIVTMVLRTPPLRITPNPWFWLLAFLTTYGTLAFTAFAAQGVPLVSPYAGNGLGLVSVTILVYALLSLGRSIGFVPAQRKIVISGAYRFVRHPIYTGTFLACTAFILGSYSLVNLVVALALVALLMVRSVVEECFLREDPEYAAYLRRVKWRWFPGIV